MSNEYKDWLEDLKNAPIDSPDHKRWLLMEYPWLRMDRDEAINYLDIEDNDVFTFIDCAPKGWVKLCEDLCAELKPLLEKAGYIDKYRLCQVKEKYGGLRWYEWDIPAAVYDEYSALIRKYEDLSYKTCCVCGAPATKMSMGWISPFCDKCAEKINDRFEPIEN
jgi:hypothetical protein